MLSTEFFYDDEDEQPQQRIIRRIIRDSSDPLQLNNNVFIQNFRISKNMFKFVLNEIDSKLNLTKTKRAVPNVIKLAAGLKFFAQGSYQLSVGNDFNLGLAQSTVSVILTELLDVMEKYLCPKEIKFSYTEGEERRAKLYFYEKSAIPNVIGCVDGTHIKIIGPKEDVRHAYYNRKGSHSLNAMIVCDDLMNIRYIDATYPGSYHDSNIWNMSKLKAKLENDYRVLKKDTMLLGDSGYPLSPYLLTPYRNVEEGSTQSRFNIKHAQGRNIVERTIGLLKSRFRCLLGARELHYSPQKAAQITNVCAALHNICLKFRVENFATEDELAVLSVEMQESTVETSSSNSIDNSQLLLARRMRDNLLRFM